ncbi:hypothetical protein BR93DRAFT_627811 [Coniochaeta sp. PMI_546]|nr:hypothetical protein BR93DRAFT_627811 [Coniochaeta sp. PMI_546]
MRDGQARDNHPSTQFRSPDGYEHSSGRLKYQMLMLLGPNPVRVVRFRPVQYHRHGRPGELLSVHLDTGLHNDPTMRDHSCSLLSLVLPVNVTSAWVATRGNKPSGSEFVCLKSTVSAFPNSGLEGKNCVNSCRAPVTLADQVLLMGETHYTCWNLCVAFSTKKPHGRTSREGSITSNLVTGARLLRNLANESPFF